jgi:hypothetical protein
MAALEAALMAPLEGFSTVEAEFTATSGKIRPHRNGTGDVLSDLRGHGRMAALEEAALMAPLEGFSTMEAEFTAMASNSRSPEKARRATDEVYGPAVRLRR